jgi:hypothetical protein
MRRRKNDSTHSLTLYVMFSIAMIIIFTIAEFVISSCTGTTHDTLTTCFYGVFGGEILCCALIKIFKLRSGSNDNTIDFPDQRYN